MTAADRLLVVAGAIAGRHRRAAGRRRSGRETRSAKGEDMRSIRDRVSRPRAPAMARRLRRRRLRSWRPAASPSWQQPAPRRRRASDKSDGGRAFRRKDGAASRNSPGRCETVRPLEPNSWTAVSASQGPRWRSPRPARLCRTVETGRVRRTPSSASSSQSRAMHRDFRARATAAFPVTARSVAASKNAMGAWASDDDPAACSLCLHNAWTQRRMRLLAHGAGSEHPPLGLFLHDDGAGRRGLATTLCGGSPWIGPCGHRSARSLRVAILLAWLRHGRSIVSGRDLFRRPPMRSPSCQPSGASSPSAR